LIIALTLGSAALAAPSFTKASSRPAVIFVPGVTGSRLENPDTGEVVWGDAAQLFSPKDRGYSTVLPLQEKAAQTDRVVATGVLDRLRMFGYTREIYRPLRRFLEKHGYHLGSLEHPRPEDDLYFFAYDWRRENQAAVTKLHRQLTKLVTDRGNPNVRLLCQSNAGRICRYLAKFGAADPSVLLPAATDPEALTKRLGPPPSYNVELMVLISNSHGGSLRQLHELHNGRKYVPGVGRFMAPETLFALRTLFEDLPFYRDDLFLDLQGVPLRIDLFDPAAWQRYQWSIFAPEIAKRLETKDPNNIFGNLKVRIAYLSKQLEQAKRVNTLLLADSPQFHSNLCLLQNNTRTTVERALLLFDQRRKRWRLLFADDKGVPKKLLPRLTARGDGHGTIDSQNFLSAQEQRAVTARHNVAGGHFDTITRKPTLDQLLACLVQQDARQ